MKDYTYEDFLEELESQDGDAIRSILMEQASDTADKLTQQECKILGIECYVVNVEGESEIYSFTDEAQDIFNIYYDEQTDELYKVLYNIHKEIEK